MNKIENSLYQKHNLSSQNGTMRKFIILAIFIVGMGVRLYGIGLAPLDFHPVKQFRSAITARAFYYSSNASITPIEAEIAEASLNSIGILGPPIFEYLASKIYNIVNAEVIWIPKLISVVFWMVGGWFLYLLTREMVSFGAAIISLAFYTLLPFGVVASRSFQPDPFMVMLMIIAIYFLVRFYLDPKDKYLVIGGVFSSLAFLVKPVCVLIIFSVYISLGINHFGFKNFIRQKRIYIFIILSFLPSFLYYFYAIFSAGNLEAQAQKSFVLELFVNFNFWDGWLKRISQVMGYTYFFGGMIGVLLFKSGWRKALLFGAWTGYLLMCLSFNYTISTHDYYHLPLIPIVALSLGSIFEVILKELNAQLKSNSFLATLASLVVIFAFLLSAGISIQAQRRVPNYSGDLVFFREVGEVVHHSQNTIMLAPFDGKPLMYYGNIAGQYWPYWFDIRDEKLWLGKSLSASNRLQNLQDQNDYDYFIITDIEEFKNQTDLYELLTMNFSLLHQDDRLLVYSLK